MTNTLELTKPLLGLEVSFFGIKTIPCDESERQVKESYAKGYEDASASYNSQILNLRSEVKHLQDQVLSKMEQGYEDAMDQVNARIPGLLIYLLEKVIASVDFDRDAIEKIIDESLSEVNNDCDHLQVSLSPGDYELFHNYADGIAAKYPKVNIISDSKLGKGDCLVISSYGTIDARVETKVNKIKEEIGCS